MTQLPIGWRWTTLGEVCFKPQYGWTTKATADGLGLKLLRTSDITSGAIDWARVPRCTKDPDDPAKYLLAMNDIVVSRAGSVGASSLITRTDRAVFASYLIRFRAKPGVDPRYVAWFLQSAAYWEQIADSTSGIAIPNVNATKLARVRLPLPPLDDQHRIVTAIEEQSSRLGAAVQSIESAEARVLALRKSVYHHLLQREWPSVSLATVVQADRPITYGILMPKENVPDGVSYVRVKDMKAEGIDIASLRRTSPVIAEAYRRSMLRAGDVLVSIRGTYGRVAVVPDQLDGANITQDTARVAPDPKILAAYLAAVLRAPAAQEYMRRVARGVAVKGVNLSDLKVLPIPLPPLESQEQLIRAIQEQADRIVCFDAVIRTVLRRAKLLRQSILNAAFTGRLVESPVAAQTHVMPKAGFVATPAGVTQ